MEKRKRLINYNCDERVGSEIENLQRENRERRQKISTEERCKKGI